MVAAGVSFAQENPVAMVGIPDSLVSIPHFEFSTDKLSPSDQFDAWRRNFAPMLELTPAPERAGPICGIEGRQVVWDLGCLVFTSISTEALNFVSLPGHVRREALDHWMMTLFLDGSASTVAGDRAFAVLRQACEAIVAALPQGKRPPAMMMALHIWSLSHGIASLFARGDAARRTLPMTPEELLEAATLIYLQGLGIVAKPAA